MVSVMPCAACSPRLWMSLMNMCSPASFCLPAVLMPKSAAVLIALTVSAPALAKPITFAPEDCPCSR
ncbi:hypothetical protein D3C72_2300030 [compost metagenome]